MAATYIQPTLSDFEAVFAPVVNKGTGERMFQLVRPDSSEAYYLGKLKETDAGALCVKVLTSVAHGRRGARGCGEDAIRAVLYWVDAEGWEKGLGKERRVNRAGGRGKTARDIVERALERARDVVRMRGSLPPCPLCGRPMVLRVSRDGSKVFYGCIGWKPNNAGCNGSRWDVPQEEVDRVKAEKTGKQRNNRNPHQGKWSPDADSGVCSCGEPATYTVKGERMCDECREGYIDGMVAERMEN